jgi:hypothetical protein
MPFFLSICLEICMAVWRVVLRPEADFGTSLRPHEIGAPELADDMPGPP